MDVLPQSRPLREEFTSAAIQGGGAAASLLGLYYLVTQTHHNRSALLGVIVYGVSMVCAFLSSALYHGIQHRRIKRVFREIDHCTIFLFIAGTYTPVALLPLRDHAGALLLTAIWTLALTGIVVRLLQPPLYARLAVPFYLAMGWLCFAWGVPLYHRVGTVPILLMLAGGLSYTGGLLFYRWHRLPFSNPLWHLCVVTGSAWFYLAITRFVRM